MAEENMKKPPGGDIEHGSHTNIGHRKENQDSILIKNNSNKFNSQFYLFAVADGMGGHKAGCIASRMACDQLANYFANYKNIPNLTISVLGSQLTKSIYRIDRDIRLSSFKDCNSEDMGTTLSCLCIFKSQSVIAHVGDSRIYRLRDGFLSCLTVDHTFVQDMIFEGEVDPKDANTHPLRHVLTSAVGAGEPLAFIDVRIDPLKRNDRFLLCTDGLSDTIDESKIMEIFSQDNVPTDIAINLVSEALQQGAKDNITAMVIFIG